MANLCRMCANFDKCIEEETADECVDNDFISYSPKNTTCEGCFYEGYSKLSSFKPCWRCIRQPVGEREDNYIPRESERTKYND